MFKALKFNLPWKRKDKKIKKIILGICAMDKKARSKPMREIIERLPDEIFEVVYFGDDCILNSPIESWPVVEVLIAFYSNKFPTQKALQYVKLRKPYMINDLDMQEVLKDRRKVYDMLESVGIDVPFHVFVNREAGQEEKNVIEEFDEYIVVNGTQINKPLVEKPVDAEDHNIYIYYPMHAGGGSKRLFRKVDDRSSEFYPNVNEVRREGSYIYEEFVLTHGTDVKVYTVGPEYGHAEARKSPVVDGRVKRDSNGREVRFPVILSQQEKVIASKVVRAFKQTVCGFDILRVQGKSYCCDVNGFSFVKNSRKYYDDASQILTEIMVNAVRPEYKSPYSTQVPLLRTVPVAAGKSAKTASNKRDMTPSPNLLCDSNGNVIESSKNAARERTDGGLSGTEGTFEDNRSPSPQLDSDNGANSQYFNQSQSRYEQEELRGVIAIIRHGDRTPKQKIKLAVSEPNFLEYFHSYVKTPTKELKVKSKSGLLRFLEVTRQVIQDKSIAPELRRKLYQIRDVLERWEISGINRKLQMKPLKWEEEEDEEASSEPATPHEDIPGRMVNAESCADFNLPVCYSSNSTSQKVPKEGKDKDGKGKDGKDKDGKEKKFRMATEILIILKWGGDLTPLGREQAENLGAKFRTEHYPESDNGGVLRLHATYRHDLKIKASDEGRVIKTAAAFTKGLLALEGQLTPIISSLVTMEEKNRQMLDRGGNFEMKEEMDRCKEHLNLLQVDKEIDDELIDELVPECSLATRKAFKELGNPLQLLKRMHYLISRLTTQLEMICVQQYAYYEAQIEAQILAEQLAATSATVNTHNSSMCSSVDPNDSIQIGIITPGGGTRERTASSSSVNMGSVNQHGIMMDNDTPSYSSTSNTPRPMMLENNMQYIELGAPEPSPPNPSSLQSVSTLPVGTSTGNLTTAPTGSAATVDPDANIYPTSMPTSNTPVIGEVEGNSIHKIDLNSSEPNEIDLNNIAPIELYLQETCDLMWDRWDKVYRDFYNNKKSQYDLTKLPDVYDMIRYDILHNSSLGLTGMDELFQLASKFERCVVPQEYGTDKEDKRYIGSKMCGALLEKIKHDLTVATSMNNNNAVDPMLYQLDQSHAEDLRINSMTRCVRTRLYFTSESHLHTVLNVLRYAKPSSPYSLSKEGLEALEQIMDVSYLSQIIIRLFQDRTDSEKYACEIIFSSGTSNEITGEKRGDIAQYVVLEKSIALQQLMGLLDESIDLYRSTREERLMAEGESQQVVVPENPLDAPMENVTDIQETHTPEIADPNAPHDASHHTPSPSNARPSSTHVYPMAASSVHYTTHSPHHSGHYYSSHLHSKRSTSITVNMDELNSLTSDRWENSAPKSNTKTFMASRSYSLHGLPGHIKVPKPLSLHPTYLGLMDDDEGLLLGNTPKGMSNSSYYTAFKARRTYNPNPMMKSYTEQFVGKSSPTTPTSANTAKAAASAQEGGLALPAKTLDALNLNPTPRTSSGASSPAKFEGRNKKEKGGSSATTSTNNSPSGSGVQTATVSLQSEKDNNSAADATPTAPKRKESFSMERLPMQPTIMETGNVVMDGGTAEESTAPTMLVGTKDKTVVVETPVRKIKVVEVADHEHLNIPSLAEVTAAASALSSGRSSPSMTNSSSNNATAQPVPVPVEEVTGRLQEMVMQADRKPIGIADTGDTPSKEQAADAADAET